MFFIISFHNKKKLNLSLQDYNKLLCSFLNLYQISLGDPKMKFLRLLLSAVCRPPIRPTIKTSLEIAPVRHPTSDLGPIQWGKSYTVGPILYDVCFALKWKRLLCLGYPKRNDFLSLSFTFRNGNGTGNEKSFPLSLSDGEGHCQSADGARLEVFTSF